MSTNRPDSGEEVDLVDRIEASVWAYWKADDDARLVRSLSRGIAEHIVADLGIRLVARVQEVALGTGAEWVNSDGEVIRGENPHFLPDKTHLFVIGRRDQPLDGADG